MSAINTRSLRWLGVVVPILFWIGVTLFAHFVLKAPFYWPAFLTEVILIVAGSALFANWVATSLDRQQAELRRRTEHLEALRDASLALTTDLDPRTVLQHVVDLSRTLVNARYAALGVLDADGRTVEDLYTAGLSDEQAALMGAPPAGHGLLGIMLHDGATLRVDDLRSDPRAAGFPPNHPEMHSLLGVPIVSKGHIFGNLYLADKQERLETGALQHGNFSAEDEDILQMFAIQAAIAIENAQLSRDNQQLAVLRERERIGMDLHDGVIQSIYAIGLLLDDARHRLDREPDRVHAALSGAIAGLNDVIQDIRDYIVDLRPQRFRGRNVKQGLEQMARELRTDTLLAVTLQVDDQAASVCTARQADEFLHIAQEALANVRKHAEAQTVTLRFGFGDGMLQMAVQDDGAGMDPNRARQARGNGLRNMRERARALHGDFRLETRLGSGTQIVVVAPIEKRDG